MSGNDKIEAQTNTNIISVMCTDDPTCRYWCAERSVGMLHLGQDVYQVPVLVCICGSVLKKSNR